MNAMVQPLISDADSCEIQLCFSPIVMRASIDFGECKYDQLNLTPTFEREKRTQESVLAVGVTGSILLVSIQRETEISMPSDNTIASVSCLITKGFR